MLSSSSQRYLILFAISLQIFAEDSFETNGYAVGPNVQAAISHYTKKVAESPDSPEFYRHLVAALRFAGRLNECIQVRSMI